MEGFATGAWLTRPVLRLAALLAIVLTAAAILSGLAGRTGPYGTLDSVGRPLGTDFTLVWSAGQMVREGRAAAVYDWPQHEAAEKRAHGTDAVPFFGWHYPPFFLLVAALLAPLSYLAALALWQAATLAAYAAVMWRILPRGEALLAALGFPAVFVCIAHGHNAFLSAALLGGGLLLLARRPLLAGALLGCLAYKPQFALIIPLALLAGGHWRALAGGALAVALLAAATLVLFGPEVWSAFLGSTGLTRTVVLEEGGTGWYKIQSVFAYVRMSGGSVALAYGVQAAVTGAVAAATARLWWIGAPFRLRAAAMILGSLLATPYLLDYDLVLLGPAIALMAGHGLAHGFRRWEKTALAFAWLVPVCTRHLAFFCHVPGGLMAMLILFVLVTGRALEAGGSRAPADRFSRSATSSPR
jgi:alpha-1,2-mannosyltransferase